MSGIDFFYIDLIAPSPDDGQSLISGPSTTTIEKELPFSDLKYLYIGDAEARRVAVQDPHLVDHFLSVFDDRRLKRVWQESRVLSTPLSPMVLKSALANPIRFITSVQAKFHVDSARLVWSDNSVACESQRFISDVVDIPLLVVLESGARKCPAIMLLKDTNALAADVIAVWPQHEAQWCAAEYCVLYRGKELACVRS